MRCLYQIDDVSPLDGIHSAVCGQFTLTENQVSRYPIELHCVLNRSERGRQREIVKHARAPLRCERLDPGLAQAVETGEVVKVRTCVMMKQMSSHKAKWTEQKERAALLANLDSEEVGLTTGRRRKNWADPTHRNTETVFPTCGQEEVVPDMLWHGGALCLQYNARFWAMVRECRWVL